MGVDRDVRAVAPVADAPVAVRRTSATPVPVTGGTTPATSVETAANLMTSRIRPMPASMGSRAGQSAPLAGRIQPMRISSARDNVVRREILDAGDLSVTTSTIESYDGPQAASVQSELKAAYYGDNGADVSLEALAEELWTASETNDSISAWLESEMTMDEVAEEISRLHETAEDTPTRREEMADALEAAAGEKAKLEFAKAEKARIEKERVSKTKQRDDVCRVIADYAGTKSGDLKTIVQNGLASAEGIDKTLVSGLTMGRTELQGLKRIWRKLGDDALTKSQGGVSLARVKMWSPGKNDDVGKKKVRGDVIDHNVNFMFSVTFAEGGNAEFNIHVDVTKADWLD